MINFFTYLYAGVYIFLSVCFIGFGGKNLEKRKNGKGKREEGRGKGKGEEGRGKSEGGRGKEMGKRDIREGKRGTERKREQREGD